MSRGGGGMHPQVPQCGRARSAQGPSWVPRASVSLTPSRSQSPRRGPLTFKNWTRWLAALMGKMRLKLGEGPSRDPPQ